MTRHWFVRKLRKLLADCRYASSLDLADLKSWKRTLEGCLAVVSLRQETLMRFGCWEMLQFLVNLFGTVSSGANLLHGYGHAILDLSPKCTTANKGWVELLAKW
jgi:hypothetical protein